MAKYDTAEIYGILDTLGVTPLRLRDGIHVIDSQNRIVAIFNCPIGENPYWSTWATPSAPLPEDKLQNAYELTEEALFQFSLVENTKSSKQNALNDMLHTSSFN